MTLRRAFKEHEKPQASVEIATLLDLKMFFRRRTQRGNTAHDVPATSASNSGVGNPPTTEKSGGDSAIRPFKGDDMKEMRLLLGMSVMEPLQTANFQGKF